MKIIIKSCLSILVLATGSISLAMEQPIEKPEDQSLVAELKKAVLAKDFLHYFALLKKQPFEKQKELCNQSLDKDQTKAIHYAAEEGNSDAIIELINHGADCNDANKLGCTPLHCAAMGGSEQVIALLLHLGARKEAVDIYGANALHYSA